MFDFHSAYSIKCSWAWLSCCMVPILFYARPPHACSLISMLADCSFCFHLAFPLQQSISQSFETRAFYCQDCHLVFDGVTFSDLCHLPIPSLELYPESLDFYGFHLVSYSTVLVTFITTVVELLFGFSVLSSMCLLLQKALVSSNSESMGQWIQIFCGLESVSLMDLFDSSVYQQGWYWVFFHLMGIVGLDFASFCSCSILLLFCQVASPLAGACCCSSLIFCFLLHSGFGLEAKISWFFYYSCLNFTCQRSLTLESLHHCIESLGLNDLNWVENYPDLHCSFLLCEMPVMCHLSWASIAPLLDFSAIPKNHRVSLKPLLVCSLPEVAVPHSFFLLMGNWLVALFSYWCL